MDIQKFVENVKEQFDDVPENFGVNTHFRELDEWSSLAALSIIAMVDDEYGIIITGDEIRKAETIQDLFNLVSDKI